MKPFKFENNVPFFTTDDIDSYGLPEIYGYENYYIVESSPSLQIDHNIYQQLTVKPIHRYFREERFSLILKYFIGGGSVPSLILDQLFPDFNPNTCWITIKQQLKNMGYQKYYNRIPYILTYFGFNELVIPNEIYRKIILDFQKFIHKFDQIKSSLSRKYIPNMKFVVMKLLERYNLKHEYKVAGITTPSKLIELNKIWDLF